MVAKALCNFKNITILMFMILNGKGSSNWLWSTWVQPCFCSSFLTGLSEMVAGCFQVTHVCSCFKCLFVCFVVSVYLSLAVEGKRRIASHVS